jgi:hypothetical protein
LVGKIPSKNLCYKLLKKIEKENPKMNLTKISNQEIIHRLDKLVKSERKITHLILWHINEFEMRSLFRGMGYENTFKYLVEHCHYSEASAYRRLNAARLLRKVPEFSEKVESGSLNLTQLSQVQSALKAKRKELRNTFGTSSIDLTPNAKRY